MKNTCEECRATALQCDEPETGKQKAPGKEADWNSHEASPKKAKHTAESAEAVEPPREPPHMPSPEVAPSKR